MEHGVCPLGFSEEEVNKNPPRDLVPLDTLDWSKELEAIVRPAGREFGSRSEVGLRVLVGEDEQVIDLIHQVRDKVTCLLTPNNAACEIASDLFRVASGSALRREEEATEQGVYTISFQLQPEIVPTELLRLGLRETTDIAYEANAAIFCKLTKAVGLPSTLSNAGQLVAAIILLTQPKQEFLDCVVAAACSCEEPACAHDGIPRAHTPIFRLAAELITNSFSPERFLYVEGAGMKAVNGFYYKHPSEPEAFVHKDRPITVYRLGTGWAIKNVKGLIYICSVHVETPPKHGWQDISSGQGASPPPIISYLGASLD